MNRKLFSKNSIATIIIVSISFIACGDKSNLEDKVTDQKTTIIKSEKVKIDVSKIDKANIQDIFKDVTKVLPDGKQMIMIFGSDNDPYSDRLKTDISNSTLLQKRIKEDFSSYNFKVHENLRHKQFHDGEIMDVQTSTMIMFYGVKSTPTIVFTDVNANMILQVPGYISTKHLLVTMDFISQGKWKDKDRENGEVYEALRDFYIDKGIDVIKKAK